MNSNLQPQVDAHQISLDLEGLDDLLEGTIELLPNNAAENVSAPAGETEIILLLLEQVRLLNQHVCEAKERLISANERMASLASVVSLQTRRLESLPYFEAEAGKVEGLKRNIALLERENEMLRQPWWIRLAHWINKAY